MRISDWSSDVCSSDLSVEELVGRALIHQKLRHPRPVLDQRDGIVPAPRGLVLTEIARQRLLPPWHRAGRDDRGTGRHRPEALGYGPADRPRALTDHRMAHDRLAHHVRGKTLTAPPRKPVSHITPPPEMAGE